MAGGLRYETGRDMPPGMAEKVAVQIARQMEAARVAKELAPSPVAELEGNQDKDLVLYEGH